MADDLNLATQGVDDGSVVAENDNQVAGGDGSQANEPFLKINDRQSYATREAAVKAYDEAGKRIASLSSYERVLDHVYGKGKHNPEVLTSHLNDYAQYLEKKKADEAREAAKSTNDADAKRFEGLSADDIKQKKAAETWLKTEADRLGYVSKEVLAKYEERLAAIEGSGKESEEASQSALVSHGVSELAKALAESKVELSEAEMNKLQLRIKAYVDGDPELVQRWQDARVSRNKADAWGIIREAATYALPLVRKGAAFADPSARQRSVTQDKIKLIQNTPRRLPGERSGPVVEQAKPRVARPLGRKENTERALALIDELEAAKAGN